VKLNVAHGSFHLAGYFNVVDDEFNWGAYVVSLTPVSANEGRHFEALGVS
jgi:hypothetical protein